MQTLKNKIKNEYSQPFGVEKIRSGQTYLYRKGGMESMVLEIKLKAPVVGKNLEQAVAETFIRFPYFKSLLVEQKGDFYLVPNEAPFLVRATADLHPLGGKEVNNYLIDLTYNQDKINLAFHHGLCDGRGLMPFAKTLIYYYCLQTYGNHGQVPGVRLAGEALLPGETTEPLNKKFMTAETRLPAVKKEGYTLPETLASIGHQDYYRYEVKIQQESLMAFAKQNQATPAIAISLFVAQAIKKIHPQTELPILVNMASDLRAGVQLENTFKNCVSSISFPYTEDFANKSLSEQATTYRELIKTYKTPKFVQENLGGMSDLFDKVDQLPTFEEKQKNLAFFSELLTQTFIISYVGQTKLGAYEQYVDTLHLYGSGITGITIEMMAIGDNITFDFMQSFASEKYMEALIAVMNEAGLVFEVSDQIKFSTPKDTMRA